jgi:hypothetical protein
MYLLPDSASYNDVNPFPAYCKSIQGSYLDLSFSNLFFTRIYYGFAIASRFYVGAQSGSGKHLLILSYILLSTCAYVHSDTAWFHLKPVVISVILSKVIWKKHRSDEEKRNCLLLIQDNN